MQCDICVRNKPEKNHPRILPYQASYPANQPSSRYVAHTFVCELLSVSSAPPEVHIEHSIASVGQPLSETGTCTPGRTPPGTPVNHQNHRKLPIHLEHPCTLPLLLLLLGLCWRLAAPLHDRKSVRIRDVSGHCFWQLCWDVWKHREGQIAWDMQTVPCFDYN